MKSSGRYARCLRRSGIESRKKKRNAIAATVVYFSGDESDSIVLGADDVKRASQIISSPFFSAICEQIVLQLFMLPRHSSRQSA